MDVACTLPVSVTWRALRAPLNAICALVADDMGS
jgi:hypothetical protein